MPDIHGLDELSRQVLSQGLCSACGACVGLCPYLVKFRGRTVQLDRCTVEQGRCHAFCPMTFFDSEEISFGLFGGSYDNNGLGNFTEIAASRSGIEDVLPLAQGGGTVTTLLLTALKQGLIDTAILTAASGDDGFPHGIVAVTPHEVLACAGSRYVGAHSLTALREALDKGSRRIGVVGLPCQVRSVRKMAMYDLKQEGLDHRIALVIGLFCNWSFMAREFSAFLAGKLGAGKVKKFDIPPPPANELQVLTDEGVKSISLDELRPLIQPGCNECPDMTSEFADLSVGMFEGRPGWNTLFVRTQAGRDLVDKAAKSGNLKTEPFPETNLQHLRQASINKKKRAGEEG